MKTFVLECITRTTNFKDKKMNARKFLVTFFIISMVVTYTSRTSHALPIGWTVGSYGGHTLITDDTGLQWLSPTASLNLSYNYMMSNMPTLFPEFTYATQAQVESLFISYGASDLGNWGTSDYGAAQAFIDEFGATGNSGLYTSTQGLTGTLYGGHSPYRAYAAFTNNADSGVFNAGSTAGVDETNTAWGSWLVRQNLPTPVPEPGTIFLLGSGLVGMVFWRRRLKA